MLILVSGSEKFVMFATLIYERDVISHWNMIAASCSIMNVAGCVDCMACCRAMKSPVSFELSLVIGTTASLSRTILFGTVRVSWWFDLVG